MKKTLGMMLTLASVSAFSAPKEIYITIGSDAVQSSQKSLNSVSKLHSNNGITLLKIKENEVERLSKLMHDKFNRCGGFVVHESKEEAIQVIEAEGIRKFAKNKSFVNYSISEGTLVNKLVPQVQETSIRDMILKLSSYKNRYYKSQTGVDSQVYVKNTWEKLASNRSDIKVELYKHRAYPQPSVILTIEGKSKKDEILVIGGHGDSIAGWFNRSRATAPGADDNASGIATITEVIRVLLKNNFQPERTIKFMSYAAEEVGLLGSKDIADKFKADGKKVVGVVQFDMTNHKGSSDLDIVFMTDFTNAAQNKFMGKLIDTYLPNISWGESKCGYGCSDHASWHNAGYPASMPFESTMEDINGHIHTSRDTINARGSQGTADHAQKFARLGVAYLVEMAK